ncbi:reverse transcriptase domain-containing protein [Tanacetum coccineum]
MFKKLHFNISFAKALAQMPKYAKMLKDLLSNKEKLLELANTPFNENFSVLEECMALADLGARINLMPLSVWKKLMLPKLLPTCMTLELANRSVAYPAGIAEDVFVQVGKFTFPADFVFVDYDVDPRVPLILGRPFLRTARALVDVYQEELTLRVGDEKLVFNVESTLKYPRKHRDESINQIDIIDTTCEDHFHEVLNVQKLIHPLSGSPTPSFDLVVASLSPSLTPFEDSDFLLEDIDAFLALDDSIPLEIDNGIYDSEGDILFLEKLLNDDPTKYLPPKELKNDETQMTKYSIEEPPKLELKDLPPHLEYAFLEGTSKLPVIIVKDLKREENDQLVKVLKSHKRVIAWKISDIKGIDPNFCTHKILMEDDFKPAIQHQRRLISTRLVTGWRVCIDHRKLNDVICKDQFPLPFMDQMLERLAGNEFYCFLDGFSGYFQIPIDPQDQEKTTFTYPYGTFSYRRMPFGLCNALGTFQRYMVAIFHDVIEKTLEVFMDDFSVFRDSFSSCLSNLDIMLKRCKDTNLVLIWEKCHFMVKEGIVLGYKISKNGIEVDRAKVDVIAKLPPPTTIDDKKGAENLAADHLSRLENPHKGDLVEMEMNDNFPHESLNMIALNNENEPSWFFDIANYLLGGVWMGRKLWIFLMLATMVSPKDIMALTTPPRKFLNLVSFRPLYIAMPMTWSNTVMHVNVKEKSHKGTKCPRILSRFVRSLTYGASTLWSRSRVHEGTSIYSWLSIMFPNRSGTPRAIISDREMTLGEHRPKWADKLDDALWAFRTAFKTPVGCPLYRLVYEKAFHLPFELEHKAYWALKWTNFDLKTAGDHRKVQLNELNELRDQAYENSLIYKEKTKKIHDSKIKNQEFHVGDPVLLFNSRLKIFSGKLKSCWSGPFTITEVFRYGTIELSQPNGPNFKVNGHG